jgi:hypothetical protein
LLKRPQIDAAMQIVSSVVGVRDQEISPAWMHL